MVRKQEMGSPMPFGKALKPDLVIVEAGEFDKDDGLKVVLSGDDLVILGAFSGMSITLGIQIEDILEAIQKHTRANAQA